MSAGVATMGRQAGESAIMRSGASGDGEAARSLRRRSRIWNRRDGLTGRELGMVTRAVVRRLQLSVLVVVVVVAAAVAPPASASITPSLTLDQSAGTAAASSVDLGIDLKFAPSGSDSP